MADNIPRGYVYFIYSRELGTVEVGFTLHPKRRLAELQAAHPYPLDLLGTVSGSYRTERRLHAKWEAHQLNGEWFVYAPICEEIARLLQPTETERHREARVRERIESFVVTPDLRAWAEANAPHVNVERLTLKWRTACRTHNYRNAQGLVENAAASWKLAMLDAEQKGQQRDNRPASDNRPAVGLATAHGMQTFDEWRALHQVQPTVTAGSNSPMLSVRSNGQ